LPTLPIPESPRPQEPDRVFTLALGLVAFVAPLAVHLFFPAIPAVKVALGLSDAAAQFNFSIALFAMALATLAYGSLSDRYGRRPLLLSGMLLFLVGSAVCALAPTAAALAFGRIVQAVGAGCSTTLVRTIARDAYRAEYLVRAIAYLTMFYTLGPMIAPLFGGVLVDTLGWRSVFLFAFVGGGLITLAAYTWILETRPKLSAEASESGIVRGYGELLRKPQFVGYVLQSGFNTATFMTIASASATLMQEVLGRPATEFGFYFLLFPVGFFLGNWVSTRIGNRQSNEVMVLAGSLLSIAAIAVQAALLLSGMVAPWTLFLPGFFVTFAQGIALPYAQVGAMGAIPRLAGTAAGIGVFMQNMGGAVFTQLYGLLADGTPVPMVTIVSCSGILCLAAGALPIVSRRRHERPHGGS
jgi:DHA1 family bicyclomycin/chloramphenicol resistance-like MFS transporter